MVAFIGVVLGAMLLGLIAIADALNDIADEYCGEEEKDEDAS